MTSRTEHDLIGDREVAGAAYYGVHTARAVENFRITGTAISTYPDLVNALAAVKHAAARANCDLGLLDESRAGAITAACAEIREGALHDQFVVDVIQGGAGTSTNMNANEVIANRALELLGHPRGDYAHLHPLEHVNLGQSTNDPTRTAHPTARAEQQTLYGSGDWRYRCELRPGQGWRWAHTFAGPRWRKFPRHWVFLADTVVDG